MKDKFSKKRRDDSNPHLLNKTAIAVLIAVAGGAIYFLTPSSESLEEKLARAQSPEVALAYLNELAKTSVRDPRISYLKAKIYLEMGNLAAAIMLLEPLIAQDPQIEDLERYLLYLKVRGGLISAMDRDSAARERPAFLNEIDKIASREFSPEALRMLTDACLAGGSPERAFEFLNRIKPHTAKLTQELYHIALAAGRFDFATAYAYAVFSQIDTLEAAQDLFKVYLQSDDPQYLSAFLQNYQGKLVDDPMFIAAEIDTAKRQGLYDEALLLLRRLCELMPTRDNLLMLADEAQNAGNLAEAAVIIEGIVEKEPDPELYSRLHDLYTWQGDLEHAQLTSLHMMEDAPDAVTARQLLSESRALADMKSMAMAYDYLFSEDLLAVEDHNDFVDTEEKTYGTQTALEKVLALRKRHPKDPSLLSHQMRLYSYLSDYHRVGQSFLELAKLREVYPEEATYAADAFIFAGEDDLALKALLSPANWRKLDDEYLNQVAQLAWTCSNDKLAAEVEKILLARNSTEVNSYYLTNVVEIGKDNVEQYVRLYQTTGETLYLTELLGYAQRNEDDALMKRLFDIVRKNAEVYDSAAVLPFRADFAMRHEDYREARAIYSLMLKRNGNDLEAISGLCNLALLENDVAEAGRLYKKYRLLFERNESSYLMAASLADALNYVRESAYWYKKYLAAAENPELSAVLAYASILEESGDPDTAFRLRKYVVKMRTDELLKLSDRNITLSSLVATFLSPSLGERVLTRELKSGKPTAALTENFLNALISRDAVKAALYYRARTELAGLRLPDYQELLLAMRAKDKERIAAILERSARLEAPSRYDALDRLNRRLDSYNLAMEKTGATGSPAQDITLRRQSAADNPDMNTSLQALYTSITKWNVSRYSLSWHAPYKAGDDAVGQETLTAFYQTSDAPSVMKRGRVRSEKRIAGSLSYETENYSVTGSIDLADGIGDDRLGFGVEATYRLNERYSVTLEGGINQQSNLSHMMMLMGRDSYVGLTFNATPYGRENFSLSFRQHKYETRFGEDLGTGFDIDAIAIAPVFLNDPYMNVYVGGTWQKNHLKENDLIDSNAYNGTALDDPNALTVGSYMGESYKRVGVGVTFGHGEPGQPGPNEPSLRYLLDIGVGYNFGEGRPDGSVRFGIATSVFNSMDELSFTGGFQTVDRQGDRAFNFTIGYYNCF